MKIIAISDTHGMHRELKQTIPQCDVLVHAGDVTRGGHVRELYDICQWFTKQPAKHVILVAGNHDKCFELEHPLVVDNLQRHCPNLIYLRDSAVTLQGIKFYGSPWQPAFCDWYFNLPRNGPQLEQRWNAIPADTDVLITHGPPWSILDHNFHGESCGCEKLFARMQAIKPKMHIFGHIHQSYGQKQIGGTLFVNASVADEQYNITRKPVELWIDEKEKVNDV